MEGSDHASEMQVEQTAAAAAVGGRGVCGS